MLSPPRKGNVPRVGGWVAWREESSRRGRVKILEPNVIYVELADGDWTLVSYGDVYPCEGP